MIPTTDEQIREAAQRIAEKARYSARTFDGIGYREAWEKAIPLILAQIPYMQHKPECDFGVPIGLHENGENEYGTVCTCGLTTTIDTIKDLFK